MPMDGVMLGFVARELQDKLAEGRIDKIIQPERDEIHLLIRAQGKNHRLVMSASASSARVHLTKKTRNCSVTPPSILPWEHEYL